MAGIILAGGKSVRMGTDKALLRWNEKTLLQHTVDLLRSVGERVVIVADRRAKYHVLGAEAVIGDEYPGTGPLGGVVTGLNYVEDGYHYVLACDMPLLKPEVLTFVYGSAEGCEACVPSVGGYLEPLCGVYHGRCRATLGQVISRGEDLSLHMALKLLDLQVVSEDQLRRIDPQMESFTNINTLEEYGRFNPSG
jgi:molybdopterin-guanine dinucleotide biosynthesis protein A